MKLHKYEYIFSLIFWITFLSQKEKSEIVSNFVVASPSWVPTTLAEYMP